MKIHLLFLLLLNCSFANADDVKEQSDDDQGKKQGETIWLEEKISPTTHWIENLVKPLTSWMEQQINEPEQDIDSGESSQATGEGIVKLNNAESNNTLEPDSLISVEQASNVAKEHIAGDVLYIKLLSKTNRYRVKLISKVGEIHNIYINAGSGRIVPIDDNAGKKPSKLVSPEQNQQKISVPDSDDENRTTP